MRVETTSELPVATMRNIAVFWVSDDLVTDHPEKFAEVLSQIGFVPTRVEHDFARRRFYYEGISRRFPEVSLQQMPTCVSLAILYDEDNCLVSVKVVPSEDRVRMYEC
jgi:hypothetical protein